MIPLLGDSLTEGNLILRIRPRLVGERWGKNSEEGSTIAQPLFSWWIDPFFLLSALADGDDDEDKAGDLITQGSRVNESERERVKVGLIKRLTFNGPFFNKP